MLEVLKPDVPVKRMVFHEITREAIDEAIENWRELDMKLVEAQEGRRILDRLVGYEMSPVALDAGRAAAVGRAGCRAWPRASSSSASGPAWRSAPPSTGTSKARSARAATAPPTRTRPTSRPRWSSSTASKRGQRPRLRRRHRPVAADARDPVVHLHEAEAEALVERLRDVGFTVASVESKAFTERPKPPFTTSTLQQEAGRKLRFSAGRTMRVAQGLYERGFITYMRTDSHEPVGPGDQRGPRADPQPVRRRVPARRAARRTAAR